MKKSRKIMSIILTLCMVVQMLPILATQAATEFKDEIEYLYITHLLHDYTLRVYRYKEGQEGIRKVVKIIRDNYKNFRKNKYFKMENLKYRIVCYLIYFNKINLLKLILK